MLSKFMYSESGVSLSHRANLSEAQRSSTNLQIRDDWAVNFRGSLPGHQGSPNLHEVHGEKAALSHGERAQSQHRSKKRSAISAQHHDLDMKQQQHLCFTLCVLLSTHVICALRVNFVNVHRGTCRSHRSTASAPRAGPAAKAAIDSELLGDTR